jgi:hypothetical protein
VVLALDFNGNREDFRVTIPIGQDRQKIILKLNAKILGILLFIF